MFVHLRWSAPISRILIALTTAIVAGSCSSIPNPRLGTNANRDFSGDTAKIRSALQQWVVAWNAKDLAGMLSTWDPDAVESFPTRSRGFGEIRTFYQRYVASDRRTQQSVDFQKTAVSGDLAYSEAIRTAIDFARDSAGIEHQGPPRFSRSLEVWRRQSDGGWRIIRSLAFPLAQNPQSGGSSQRVDTLGAEQQIRNSLAAWLSAYDRQDYVAMSKVWAPDILGWYPELPPFTIDEVRRGLSRQRAQDPTRAHIDLTIDEVLVQGDMAVVRDIWYYTRRFGTDSTIKRRMWGYEVWRKQPDGAWRISRYLSAPEKWVRIQ